MCDCENEGWVIYCENSYTRMYSTVIIRFQRNMKTKEKLIPFTLHQIKKKPLGSLNKNLNCQF